MLKLTQFELTSVDIYIMSAATDVHKRHTISKHLQSKFKGECDRVLNRYTSILLPYILKSMAYTYKSGKGSTLNFEHNCNVREYKAFDLHTQAYSYDIDIVDLKWIPVIMSAILELALHRIIDGPIKPDIITLNMFECGIRWNTGCVNPHNNVTDELSEKTLKDDVDNFIVNFSTYPAAYNLFTQPISIELNADQNDVLFIMAELKNSIELHGTNKVHIRSSFIRKYAPYLNLVNTDDEIILKKLISAIFSKILKLVPIPNGAEVDISLKCLDLYNYTWELIMNTNENNIIEQSSNVIVDTIISKIMTNGINEINHPEFLTEDDVDFIFDEFRNSIATHGRDVLLIRKVQLEKHLNRRTGLTYENLYESVKLILETLYRSCIELVEEHYSIAVKSTDSTNRRFEWYIEFNEELYNKNVGDTECLIEAFSNRGSITYNSSAMTLLNSSVSDLIKRGYTDLTRYTNDEVLNVVGDAIYGHIVSHLAISCGDDIITCYIDYRENGGTLPTIPTKFCTESFAIYAIRTDDPDSYFYLPTGLYNQNLNLVCDPLKLIAHHDLNGLGDEIGKGFSGFGIKRNTTSFS